MLLKTDRRRLEYSPLPAVLDTAQRAARRRRETEIQLARALRQIDEEKAYVDEGFASALSFGVRRLGLAKSEARMLLRCGQVLAERPELAEELLRLVLTVPAVAAIEPMICDPHLIAEHEHWLDRARHDSIYKLQRAVRRRQHELRCGEMVVPITVHVPESVDVGFSRACRIARDKAGRWLTRSEAFEALVDHYLDCFDVARQTESTRRVGPTADRPRDRYIPISVRRAVRRRAVDTCEFPGCFHRAFLQFAHWRRRHATGSPREVEDLLLLCGRHHLLLDAGFFVVLGTADAPVFVTPKGTVFDKWTPRGRGAESEAENAAWRGHPLRRAPRGPCRPDASHDEALQPARTPQDDRPDDAARAPPTAGKAA